MPDDNLFPPTAIKVPIIQGTGEDRLPASAHGALLETPGAANANVVAIVVQPIVALAIRFAYAYLTTLVGLVTAGMTPYGQTVIPTADFSELLYKSALLSVAGPTVALLKDLVTIFGRLEGKYPLMTGNV